MSTPLLRLVALLCATVSLSTALRAQGCVAARGCGMTDLHGEADASRPWELTVAHRFFESDRHFVGGVEQHERRNEGSEVINQSHFVDVTLSRRLNDRFGISLALPFVSHDRSQALRDASRKVIGRFHTQSAGIGDARLEATWLAFAPAPDRKAHLQLGLGLALPTGNKSVRDTFTTYNATTGVYGAEVRTVDQSIQPGTGGYAVLLSVAFRYDLHPRLQAYIEGSYSATPQESNGVPTFRSNPFETKMAIADTYLARSGLSVAVLPAWGLSASLGLRIEGVPVRDLVGGSNGFRRPGYSLAIEPGLSIDRGTWSARLYVPTAITRNRLRSVADEQYTASSGVYRHGDAAFADYLVASSVTVRF
ncbi:hypothetical protein [Nibricoccus sp. IMCC34717]|uniref:hypothetical protein n=1 Tax=Nibricoccus sp. IMCC34717 TaxID=3034021 RepID=UPI00384F1E8A